MPSQSRTFYRRWRKKVYCWLSFLHRDWRLRDYPVTVRPFGTGKTDPGQAGHIPNYEAYIEGWHLYGLGDTPREARARLASAFEKARANRAEKPLPRPGTLVPFEFASTERIDQHGALVDDFLKRVLDAEAAWVSDQSGLGEFCVGHSPQVYIDRIREVYGVDCSDLASATLVEILDRIAASQGRSE